MVQAVPILASASYDQTIKLWNVVAAQCTTTIQHNESQVNALTIGGQGQFLAAASFQYVRMYDLARDLGRQTVQYEVANRNVLSVQFVHDGKWMITGSEDGVVKLYDLGHVSQTYVKQYDLKSSVSCVRLHPNQVELFAGDQNGRIWTIDIRYDNAKDSIRWEHHVDADSKQALSVQSITIDEDATKLAAVTNTGKLYAYSLVGAPAKHVSGAALNMSTHQEDTDDVDALIADAMNDAPGNESKSMSGTHFGTSRSISAHNTYALSCHFSPDSTMIATTSADHTAKLWRTVDYSEICTLRTGGVQQPRSITAPVVQTTPKDTSQGSQKWVWDCAFTRDSKYIFTCSSDNCLRLWSTEGGPPIKQYAGHKFPVTAMAFRDV